MDEKNNENIDFKKRINENESVIEALTKRVNELNESVEKLKIRRGERTVSKFKISGNSQWDLVERTLLQKGILLEHEIFKSLEEMGIVYEPNDSFYYPTEKGLFYIDSFFSNNNLFHYFEDSLEVKTMLFETDAWIQDREIIQDDSFLIRADINYIIECKSRSNPPINYLFVLDKSLSRDEKKRNSFLTIKGSKFIGNFILEIDNFWRTRHDPIQISYPNLHIDEKETLNTAFWQLFKRIDHDNNSSLDHVFFYDFNFSEIKLPDGVELPHYIDLFSTYYDKMKKNNLIPEKLKEKIVLDVSIFVPIIVVNSNIYSIDLDPKIEKNFKDRVTREPGFIKEFSYLKQGSNEGHKFIDLTRFVMTFLREWKICFEGRKFFPMIFEPILDIFVISSSHFSSCFEKIRNQIKNEFIKKMNSMKDGVFLENREELMRYQVLKWMLSESGSLRDDLISKLNEEYKSMKERNLQLRFNF